MRQNKSTVLIHKDLYNVQLLTNYSTTNQTVICEYDIGL